MLNVLLFVFVYLGGIARGFFSHPFNFVLVYQLVYFFNPSMRWWGNKIPDIGYSFFVVVFMLVVFVLGIKKYDNKLFDSPPFKWVFLVILSYIIVTPFAVFPEVHRDATINFIKLGIIISLIYKLTQTKQQLHYLLYAYIFGCWYIGFQAFEVGRNAYGRIEGIGMVDSPDANGTAAALVPSAVFCLYYFWHASSLKQRALIVVAGAFIVNGLVLINSRGAFLGVLVGVAFFLYSTFQSKVQIKHKMLKIFSIVFLGAAAILTVIDQSTIERFYTMTNYEVSEEQESGATRFVFWQGAIEMAKDHPMGAGNKGFEFYSPFYVPEDIDTGKSRNRSVHSSWFEVLSESGIFGLSCFMMLFVSCFATLKKLKKRLEEFSSPKDYFLVTAVQGGLLGYMVAMTFLNRARAEILYWMVLFICIAYNLYIVKEQKADSHKVATK